MKKAFRGAVLAAIVTGALASAPAAFATFPGQNGKIAFDRGADIWTMNPDGTGQVDLTNNAGSPSWSADGTRIAFTRDGTIWVMLADGSNATQISNGPRDFAPSWSPDDTQIAFGTHDSQRDLYGLSKMNADGTGKTAVYPTVLDNPVSSTDWSPAGDRIAFSLTGVPCVDRSPETDIVTIHPDGTGLSGVTGHDPCAPTQISDTSPSWSPDAQRIAFASDDPGCDQVGDCAPLQIWSVKPDATGLQRLTTAQDPIGDGGPVWSPDGTKIAFTRGGRIKIMQANGTNITDVTDGFLADWQPIPINSYPRPRGASPMRISLVPAYKQCTAPNATHGAPLSYGSCGSPQFTSSQLTTGSPDSNGLVVKMEASLLLRVVAGNSQTPADEADVKIDGRVNDVFNKDLTDYTGALRASLPLRVTDKDNTPSPGSPGAGTTEPFQYGFDIPCTPDPLANIGSDCAISTTADTLVPGTIKESLRTIWQIGRVRVDDAGPDGDPDATADNTVFLTQGVFVP